MDEDEEHENTGYVQEREEAQLLDSTITDQLDVILLVQSQQIILLHNQARRTNDVETLMSLTEGICALTIAYHRTVLLQPR